MVLQKHHKEIDKTIKSQIKNDLSQLKKMTKKVHLKLAQMCNSKKLKKQSKDLKIVLLLIDDGRIKTLLDQCLF